MMMVVSVEEVYVEALQVKYPIIDWEVYSEDTRRDDLVKLWDLVKERFSTTEPTYDKEKELLVELKRLFEPDIRGHDIFMLVEKDYPLSKGVQMLMLANKLYFSAHSTSTMDMEVDASDVEDNRWSLKEEVTTLMEDTLRLSFPDLKEEQPMLFGCKKEYGDYQCENVLSIWPHLRNNPESDFKKPTDVGEEIKKHLEKRDDMIKEVSIHDIGIVTFRLSGKWMAESIHKMLRAGIDTWAPKLYVGKVMVNFPSWDIAGETRVASFRRAYITNTLVRLLKYSKIDVTVNKGFSEADDKKKAHDEVHKCFLIEDTDENVMLSYRAADKLKPLVCGKKDRGFGNASKDLSYLWYGLEKEKANWIVYVTPVQQQEYIEMCITAARHAGWLPDDRYKSPDTSYAGYQSCSTEVEKLINTLRQLVFFFDLSASLLDCALRYTFLKNHRLADCTLDIIELVKEEGNTLRHLLKTRDKIRSFTTKSSDDIDELKKVSELTLGEGEVWEEGVERVLGLHLLMFTEVLEESCLSVLPHILCEYLYDLSVKFGHYHTSYNHSVYEVGSVAESTRLLLFEATGVVMDKCFHLLGITLEHSSSEVSIAQSLVSSAEQPMDVNELKDVNAYEADVESVKKKQKRAVDGATEHTSITSWPNLIARITIPSFDFIAGQAALKATLGKVTKHEKACIENQHVFIPFAFDTFGFLASEAVELLSRVQWVMHSNVMTPRPTYVVFKRIDFAIQKGLSAHLVVRLSSITI
ncbi:arginine--tRNA ligase, chloroplastic/mitochondrial [Tanacetum coccineum]